MPPVTRNAALCCFQAMRARTLLSSALLGIATIVVDPTVHAASKDCPRKFNDAQIDRILIEKLPVHYDHRTEVRYVECTYYVVVWGVGAPVDSQSLIELDENGNLPKEVVQNGYHGSSNEDVSLRKAPMPKYPPAARAAGITGSVLVRATVVPDSPQQYGAASITDATIVQVSPATATALADGLIDALRAWKFNPRVRYGNVIPRDIMVRFRFSIGGNTVSSEEPVDLPDDVVLLETIDING